MSFRSKLRVHFFEKRNVDWSAYGKFLIASSKKKDFENIAWLWNLRCFKYVDAVSCFHLYKRAVGRRSACK